MNASRPIDPSIFTLVLAWFMIAVGVAACLVFMATRGQSLVGKLLYTIGGLCLLTLPAAIAFDFALTAWYGGRPDLSHSAEGRFYVRAKHRLTPVSEDEFQWLRRMQQGREWFLGPCILGGACIGIGRLLRPRAQSGGEPVAT